MRSIVWRKTRSLIPLPSLKRGNQYDKAPFDAKPNGALLAHTFVRSERGLGLRPEVVVVGHFAVDIRIQVPLHRPPGERELGLDDLLEHRNLGRLVPGDLIEDVELRLKDAVRRLEEPN